MQPDITLSVRILSMVDVEAIVVPAMESNGVSVHAHDLAFCDLEKQGYADERAEQIVNHAVQECDIDCSYILDRYAYDWR